ncbi:protein FAM210B, mitochondrial [Sphaeramia orbicularis]|uniref:DUF1279 domain-containing protein n=1 Tax=Sphaeramia orbicularis TaxID=375764 RepID=A0A673A4T8_9TELE|nr:protein FAM210B, mitochondrial [Sphaeramia orbicularis]
MFLCRSSRLCAAAVDQALRSPGWFSVHTNRLTDVTVTLHKGHAFQTHRAARVSTGGVHEWKRQQEPEPHRLQNSDCAFIVTNWQHLDRIATIAAGLSKSAQSKGANSDISTRPLICAPRLHGSSRRQPPGDVWFTGTCGLFTRTMQTRASSTAAAAAKRRDVDEQQQQPTDCNKEDEQNLKDASATSSSTAKAPGEPEPEGGKPSKTQQLKKVFKEYGAVGVSFHIGISLMSLGMFYLLISSGIDMAAVLCKVGFSEAVVKSKMAAGTSTFVLAYAIHKLFAPVRISITLMSVPLIVRYFRKTGLFKPPSPAP